ncbi:MAG: acyl-CoA dehydrogenase family protein [Alphaproteobacteria bacterium]|nr:acyl-CoA dehydrogenase family protein [Alphaproteobacteria bacterium]
MDFDLTDEQRLLKESVERLLADHYGFDKRRGYLADPAASAALWARYAGLGLLGLPFAEEHGGIGGGGIEIMLVMEAFGRVLALEPFLATIVLGGAALRLAGNAAQLAALLPRIAAGELTLAFAHGERQARYDLSDVITTARRNGGGGWVLDGAKSVVLHGDGADRLVISARISGERDEPDGIGLFLVDAKATGVARRAYTMRDGMRAADIALSGVEVGDADALGEPGAAYPIVERIVQAGIAAVAAEAVGAMEALQALTLEYLKTRVQFGRPIGDNQALQHRAAEMMMALEQGRSMAMLAAIMVDEPNARERAHNISMAKVGVGQSARFVSQNAVQLHGGIGMTEEYAVGHYFRRCMVIEHSFGDTAHHLGLLAAEVA